MFRRPVLNWLLIVCSLICASVIGVSFETVQSGLDRLVDDGSADFFSPEVHRRFRTIVGIYGSIFFGTALLGYRRTSLTGSGPDDSSSSPQTALPFYKSNRPFWIAVCVCSLVATVVRLVYLTQPMRYDEAYTYNTYISRGILAAVSTYESPNNHLLNTVFSWVAVKTFGNSPPALRLPAFLAGILCVAATMMLAYRIAGNRAAILAGTLVALSSPLIEYSTNARGYTFLGLFTILAWLSSVELIRHDRCAARWTLAASIGLGLAAIPVMLLPLLMLGAWIGCFVWKSRDRAGIACRILPSLLGGGLIAFVLYSPILIVTGPVEFLANASGQNLDPRPLTGNMVATIDQLYALLFRDVPWPVLVLLVLGVVGFLWRLTPVFRFGRVAGILSTIACFLPLILLSSLPPARVWLFLLPLFYVICSSGISAFVEASESRVFQHVTTFILVALAGVWPFINTTVRDSILNSTETGAFPDSELILNDLGPLLQKSDQIYTVGPIQPQLVYYAEKMGIDRHQFPNPGADEIADSSLIICPHKAEDRLDKYLKGLVPGLDRERITSLSIYPNSTVYRVNNAQK